MDVLPDAGTTVETTAATLADVVARALEDEVSPLQEHMADSLPLVVLPVDVSPDCPQGPSLHLRAYRKDAAYNRIALPACLGCLRWA